MSPLGSAMMWRALLVSLAALFACALPKAPGELVGAYHITGALTDNSCGSDALPAHASLSFDVQIRQDHGMGFWVQGQPPARSGHLDDKGSFSFALENSYDVNAMSKDPAESLIGMDPEKLADPTLVDRADQRAMQHCRMAVTESIQGMLVRDLRQGAVRDEGDAAAPKTAGPDLVGDNEIAIRAVSGSNCSAVLAAQGGPFRQLPCSAHYDLEGVLK